MTQDNVSWKSKWSITRFNDPTGEIAAALQAGKSMTEALAEYKDSFLGSEQWEHNVALNEGLQELINLAFGIGSPTAFDATAGYLGAGDSDTAAAASQTGLQAATNKTYVVFDDNYPARTNQTVECRATFGSAVGNHAWKEFTIANGNSDAAVNLNRKVEDKGTKASGESWTLSLSITFS